MNGRSVLVTANGVPVASGARAKTIRIDNSAIDITSDDDLGYLALLAGEVAQHSIDITIEGVLKDAVLLERAVSRSDLLFTLSLSIGPAAAIPLGPFLLVSLTITGPTRGAVTYRAFFQSAAGLGIGYGYDTETWRYLLEAYTSNSNYSAEAFDDSAWSTARLPVGSAANPGVIVLGYRSPPLGPYGLEQAITLRRKYYVLGEPFDVQLDAFIDNTWTVWVNGVQYATATQATGGLASALIPAAAFRTGENTLAIRINDDEVRPVGTDLAYFDLKITQYVADLPD